MQELMELLLGELADGEEWRIIENLNDIIEVPLPV